MDRLYLPEAASNLTDNVDFTMNYIMLVSIIFALGIFTTLIFFVIRYHRSKKRREQSATHNTVLELTWSIIPGLLLIPMFVLGFRGFMDMYTPPANTYDINVVGAKWFWTFIYPEGFDSDELHVPKDRPVRLIITSQDVIHSVFIRQFRVKRDAVPGRYNEAWFIATKATDPEKPFEVFCTEYCGTNHSTMMADVVVHETEEEFNAWIEKASDIVGQFDTLAEAGEALYNKKGCTQCHTVDGTASTGPTFQGIWQRQEQMADGTQVTVDENYIRESLLEPNARVVAGYNPVMPSYKGRLKEKEIMAIIEYFKTLEE